MEDIKNWYNEIAEGYDELYGEEQIKKIRTILFYYKKLFNSKIFDIGLDFGCGTGISIMLLKQISKVQYACDISQKMLEIARKKHPDVKFIDCNKIESYKDYFDVITSITVLQDVKNPLKYLELFNNLIRDKGLVILSVLKRKGINFWKPLAKKYFTILWFLEEEKDFIFFLSKKF